MTHEPDVYIMSQESIYTDAYGHGFDFEQIPSPDGSAPVFFSVKVPDGNYVVSVTLGNPKRESNTIVRAESRRMMLENVSLAAGQTATYTFIVNKRSPAINNTDSVKLNPREMGTMTWDDKLTLEFNGESPAVESVSIRPAEEGDSVTTVFLCGDSTVVDQTYEPWASWGQMIPAWFDSNIAVANNAESGEKTSSFLSSGRLDKVLSMAKPGDWIIIEFGHNDQKETQPGAGAWYNFTTNLKVFLDRARAAQLNPVLITPTARRIFDDNGKIKDTHLDYPDAMRAFAERNNVPIIDLNVMTKILYESLGTEDSKKAFVHYPANRFPGQEKALADNTHFNPFGAVEVAKCVSQGLRENVPELAKHLTLKETFNPSIPDNPDNFKWYQTPFIHIEKPLGD
ncbi:MAG: rhamnogalacturonan acetylesterase [Bacteroides sp.]|nr:rhamnogalacturonan acetylesterase [Bacteroides sp.]